MPSTRPLVVGVTALALAGVPVLSTPTATAAPAAAATESAGPRTTPPKQAVAVGRGGAVSSVDPYATRIGLRVLARGGNATDAAVATAAALGVTEPYSAGIGGGGYFVRYAPRTGEVTVIDGRETAPLSMRRNAFLDPETGDPYEDDALFTSGAAVGVPGTPRTWDRALRRWGSFTLRRALAPAARLAERGFTVDETFALQTEENAERFAQLRPTARLFLPGGEPPEVGSTFRNPELGATYRLLAERGVGRFYRGPLADQILRTVRNPPTTAGAELPVPSGFMRAADLLRYRTRLLAATHVRYRGLDVYGMPPSSSGGTTVGEALNILERLDVPAADPVQALHSYLEASALAFADRAAYLGDPAYVDVPVRELLSQGFGSERACEVDPDQAAVKPVPAGEPDGDYAPCEAAPTATGSAPDLEGKSTTHLTVVDRHGSMVAYTLTIEQTGGSAITVPRRGFLLNNELTDFSVEYVASDPNRIQGGKRPRSSMSPTIVLRDDRPWLALGSPGGSTIITTVLQTLLNRVDLGMSLPAAIAAPRASQRNEPDVTAEQSFIDAYGSLLEAYGHTFVPAGDPGTSAAEIGAVAAVELKPGGRLLAAAEPERRGGGAAGVVRPLAR